MIIVFLVLLFHSCIFFFILEQAILREKQQLSTEIDRHRIASLGMDDNSKLYENLKNDLKKSLQEKRDLEDEFDRLQQEIYDKETEYLSGKSTGNITIAGSKTTYGGNIIKGFDGFNKTHHHGHGHGHDSASHNFSNDDRLFSLSSAIFVKQQHQEDSQD